MKRTIFFFISFLSIIIFAILFFQNVGLYGGAAQILMSYTYVKPSTLLLIGFIMGIISGIFALLFVIGGGSVRITGSKSENSEERNLEWD